MLMTHGRPATQKSNSYSLMAAMNNAAGSRSPQVIRSAEEMSAWSAKQRALGKTIGLVPTMGSLHRGHLSLVDLARENADAVVVSIFVNPLQFGEGEDFDSYPRDVNADIRAVEGHGVDVVFVPGLDDIYPTGPANAEVISAGPMGEVWEGAHRPGHFDGVLTVVNRLFEIVSPDVAVFGKKDAQQLVLVEDMVRQRGLAVRIIRGEIVRDADGLALSSRNVYLTPEQRQQALVLSQQLMAISSSSRPDTALSEAQALIESTEGVELDYLESVSPQTLQPRDLVAGEDMMVVGAVRVGSTRLLDNVWRENNA